MKNRKYIYYFFFLCAIMWISSCAIKKQPVLTEQFVETVREKPPVQKKTAEQEKEEKAFIKLPEKEVEKTFPSRAEPKRKFLVNILVFREKNTLKIFSPALVLADSSGRTYRFGSVEGEEIRKAGGNVLFRGASYKEVFLQTADNSGKDEGQAVIGIENKKYRGKIHIISYPGGLNAINHIDIEDYLKGVVPREISPSWPHHSQCAQAIAARTYILKNLGKHGSAGADLCDTICCQVYGGYNAEHENSNQAVEDTRGMVLVYNKSLASTFYHSSCGGATEDVRNTWSGSNPEPYLRGRRCTYCKEDSRYEWKREITLEYTEKKLRSAGINVSGIRSLRVVDRSSSGRASRIEIISKSGKHYVAGHRFRTLLDPNVIYSTKFSCKVEKGKLYLLGNGWGHGVGLCQWGAKGLAEKGFTYKQILLFYYNGTHLEKIVYE